MTSTATAWISALVVIAGDPPGQRESERGERDDDRHENACHDVGKTLDRRFGA
jgi:hypothetical protein